MRPEPAAAATAPSEPEAPARDFAARSQTVVTTGRLHRSAGSNQRSHGCTQRVSVGRVLQRTILDGQQVGASGDAPSCFGRGEWLLLGPGPDSACGTVLLAFAMITSKTEPAPPEALLWTALVTCRADRCRVGQDRSAAFRMWSNVVDRRLRPRHLQATFVADLLVTEVDDFAFERAKEPFRVLHLEGRHEPKHLGAEKRAPTLNVRLRVGIRPRMTSIHGPEAHATLLAVRDGFSSNTISLSYDDTGGM